MYKKFLVVLGLIGGSIQAITSREEQMAAEQILRAMHKSPYMDVYDQYLMRKYFISRSKTAIDRSQLPVVRPGRGNGSSRVEKLLTRSAVVFYHADLIAEERGC